MDKAFYYQIKAKKTELDEGHFSSQWVFPPVMSGRVYAKDKKEARSIIDDEHGKKFPMRVARKDLDDHEYLLNLWEIKDGDDRTNGLFEVRECLCCGQGYRVIDHYNNIHEMYKGRDYCSWECKEKQRAEDKLDMIWAGDGKHAPVIYQITNIKKNMVYIGQTTQAVTLRWWQHLFHGTGTKFHKAIKESDLCDWSFSVIEEVKKDDKPDGTEMRDYLFEREMYWIKECNSIEDGYNTAVSKKIDEVGDLGI